MPRKRVRDSEEYRTEKDESGVRRKVVRKAGVDSGLPVGFDNGAYAEFVVIAGPGFEKIGKIDTVGLRRFSESGGRLPAGLDMANEKHVRRLAKFVEAAHAGDPKTKLNAKQGAAMARDRDPRRTARREDRGIRVSATEFDDLNEDMTGSPVSSESQPVRRPAARRRDARDDREPRDDRRSRDELADEPRPDERLWGALREIMATMGKGHAAFQEQITAFDRNIVDLVDEVRSAVYPPGLVVVFAADGKAVDATIDDVVLTPDGFIVFSASDERDAPRYPAGDAEVTVPSRGIHVTAAFANVIRFRIDGRNVTLAMVKQEETDA